ncbi:MAG: hypothetical protein RR334_04060, partial [Clostridia bacterium]
VEFNIPFKEIEIFDIKVAETEVENLFQFDITCSAGTYVRSLARDISAALGTVATMVSIIRLRSGKFLLENAKTTDEIAEDPDKYIISIEQALKDEKQLCINDLDYYRFKTGQEIYLEKEYCDVNEDIIVLLYKSKVIAIAEIVSGRLLIKIRFNNEEK